MTFLGVNAETNSATKELSCSLEKAQCGAGYTDICEGDVEGKDCISRCVTTKIVDQVEFPHQICLKDGTWLDSKKYPAD